jgi:6-phosphogluconate dehydrogenase
MTSFAVIGLSTMGGNLARNAARRGIPVAVHNRTVSRTEEFLKDHGSEVQENHLWPVCGDLEKFKRELGSSVTPFILAQ